MCKRFIFILFVFCAFLPAEGLAQYIISGRVVGHDGKPVPRADVMLLSNAERFPRAILKMYRTDNDGAFVIDLPRPGLYRLLFAGVHHKPLEVPIYAVQKDTVIMNVRLAAIRYKDEIKEITFLADYDADSLRLSRAQAADALAAHLSRKLGSEKRRIERLRSGGHPEGDFGR